jgi:replication factor C subunit 1
LETEAVEEDIKKDKPVEKPKNPKANYFAMQRNKEGPKALGTRPQPVGAENCLEGLTFVISGEYETLTRNDIKDIVMRYGG